MLLLGALTAVSTLWATEIGPVASGGPQSASSGVGDDLADGREALGHAGARLEGLEHFGTCFVRPGLTLADFDRALAQLLRRFIGVAESPPHIHTWVNFQGCLTTFLRLPDGPLTRAPGSPGWRKACTEALATAKGQQPRPDRRPLERGATPE